VPQPATSVSSSDRSGGGDEAHYLEVYASQEYQDIVKDLGIKSHDYRVERFGRERVRLMTRTSMRGPRYLDVGCSTGFVVEAAARPDGRPSAPT
jgi:hypothetical protein